MFVGAIEAEFRRWLDLNKEAFRGRNLYLGCSGNFTIEQILGPVAGGIHSNDVSIYSHFLGHYLAQAPFDATVKLDEWKWIEPFLEANPGAAIVLLFELLKWERCKNFFEKRIYDEMLATWEYRFEKTVENVDRAKELCRLTTYRSSDIFDFCDEALTIDPNGIFLAFLPFYKGGYERLYKRLDEILEWDRPKYEIIDAARKAAIVEKVKRFDHVIIDDVEHPGEPAVMLKRKTETKQMWLYSNLPVEHVLVQNHPRMEPSYYPMLTDADIDSISEDSVITYRKVKAAEMNYYRNRFLAKRIDFRDGGWNYLVFVDGRLFGFCIVSLSKYGDAGMYVMSDFVVPMPKSNRLSKLMLLLMQSVEFRDMCQDLILSRVPTLYTTAFTDKPVSMKYRGLWELAKRGEDKDGKKFLNYQTATGLHTGREALSKWLTRYKRSSNN